MSAWISRVAAVVVVAYVAAVAVGWVTNARDGYYGVLQVEAVPDGGGGAGAGTGAGVGPGVRVVEVAANSPAERAGLRAGDVILAVDGGPPTDGPGSRSRRVSTSAPPAFRIRPLAIPAGDAPAFRRLAAERAAGDRGTLRVQRRVSPADGRAGSGGSAGSAGGASSASSTTEELSVVLDSHLAAPGVVVGLVTWNAAGLLALAVGVVVALRRPAELAARLLLLMGACFSLALALLTWNNRPFSPDAGPTLARLTALLLVVGSAALLHLFLAFPAPNPLLSGLRSVGGAVLRRMGGAAGGLYAIPLLLSGIALAGPVESWPWAYLVVITVIALGLVALTRSVLRPPSAIARAQLKWIAGALAVAVVALVLGPGISVATRARVELLSPTATVAALALLPVGIGIAVLRYRLFDVDLVLRAATFYPLLAALLAGGYFGIAVGLSRAAVAVIGPRAADNAAVSVVAALLVAAAAQPLHRRLQNGLDRLLYRERLARQRLLREAAEALGRALPPAEVAAFLTGHVTERLNLDGAWLVSTSGVTASSGEVPESLAQAGEPLRRHLRDAPGPVLLTAGDEPAMSGLGSAAAVAADEPALARWYAAGGRLLLPLQSAESDGVLAVWVLGARRTGALLGSEDVAALAQVGRQAAVLLDYERLYRQEAVERQRTARFRRYFSPQIADLIAGERAELASHRRELTVMVVRLHGSEALSDAVEPEVAVRLLNAQLAAMTEVVFAHGGTLDEYRGDGIVAFFGDPLPQPDHAARAVRAAREIERRVVGMGQESTDLRLTPGVGVASGWVTAGTIGSATRQEYTVVGDAVNVAAGLASAALGEVLLSDATRLLLGEEAPVVARGEMALSGRRLPVEVFALADEENGTARGAVVAPRREARDGANGASGAGPFTEVVAAAELLARLPLFGSLSAEERRGLAARLRRHTYRKGALISGAGAADGSVFIVRSGTVKLVRALPTGDEAVMSIFGPGELFGELVPAGGGDTPGTLRTPGTAVALEATEVLALSRQEFLAYLQAYPTAASAALGVLGERIQQLGDQLEESYALDLPQRLARRLLALGSTHGKQTSEGLTIELPLTQSDLAGMVGASRQRVNRQLAEWQDRRVLRLGPHGAIVLLEPEALRELSQVAPAG